MARWLCPMAVVVLAAVDASAHHIWIIPQQQPGGPKAVALFSDYLVVEGPSSVEKVAHTRLWVRDRAGKEAPLTWEKAEGWFELDVPGEGERTVGGVCVYGVQTHDHRLRREVEPYLLTYYAKTVLNAGAAARPWDRLALEIIPEVSGKEVRLQVFFQGKPAPGAEMRVHAPGEERKELKTDANGVIRIAFTKPGVYGFQTRYVEGKAGEHEGKKYVEVRHHATLVLPFGMEAESVGK